jgi:hypothetical protein
MIVSYLGATGDGPFNSLPTVELGRPVDCVVRTVIMNTTPDLSDTVIPTKLAL